MDVQAAIRDQYHAALAMLRQEIERCPDDLWLAGEHPRAFWRIVYHALFFTHFYLQPSLETFRDWEKHRPESQCLENVPWPPFGVPQVVEAYSKEEMLEYWDVCDAAIDDGVNRLDLDAPECGFPWYQMRKLNHQLMNIRHTQQHVGQLAELLYAAGVELDWIGSGP
jgi:hypothetical protein